MCALEQSCWLLYNELSNLELFDLETEVAQYVFQRKQSFIYWVITSTHSIL